MDPEQQLTFVVIWHRPVQAVPAHLEGFWFFFLLVVALIIPVSANLAQVMISL
jgi:hypothetical protein